MLQANRETWDLVADRSLEWESDPWENYRKGIRQGYVTSKRSPSDLTHSILPCPPFHSESQVLVHMNHLGHLLKFQLIFTHLSSPLG